MSDAWVPARVGELNAGDHITTAAILHFFASNRLFALCMNEMHDNQRILKELEGEGLRVFRGTREDSEADPVIWDPKQFRVDKRSCTSHHLLDAGKRDGKHNMAKSLNRVKGNLIVADRFLNVASCHNIQTQYTKNRKGPAREFVQNVVDVADPWKFATIIGADWNAKVNGPSMKPLRDADGWWCDQVKGIPLPTLGSRPIDHFWVQDKEKGEPILKFVRHYTQEVKGTDHDGLVMVLKVRKR